MSPGRAAVGRLRLLVGFGLAAAVTAVLTAAAAVALWPAPMPPRLEAVETSKLVLDRDGALLRPFTVADGRWRLPVRLEEIDARLVEMVIAYEDRRFRTHSGVDIRALMRAAAQAVTSGRIVSGGSTITMQLARLSGDGTTRSLRGKLRQIRTARAIERLLSKNEILTRYFTLAPYGGNLEGVRAATLAYFGKEPRRLTVAEAALLVALPQAPEARRPDRDAAIARRARDRVLDRLARLGVIDEETVAAAKTEAVPAARRTFPIIAAHEGRRALARAPERRIHRLTIDRGLQERLESLAAGRAEAIGDTASVAILVADHRTGEILASVGSAGLLDDRRGGHVDMTRALRSPGSALKPLIYGLAFEAGLAHPQSLVEDRPTRFAGYEPNNFDQTFQGTVSIKEALALSLNVPAVLALDAVGPSRLVARMRRAGVKPALPALSAPGLAVGLGGVPGGPRFEREPPARVASAVRDLDDAIGLANATAFGLSSGIVTNNLEAALKAVRGIRTGTVNVNQVPGYRIEKSPFGGVKDSGLGVKEGVIETIKTMTTVKTFSLPW